MMSTILVAIALAAAPPRVAKPNDCQTSVVRSSINERSNADLHRSPKIVGGGLIDTIFRLSKAGDPLTGKLIISEDPTHAVAMLDDGSGVAFRRDCSRPPQRCVYLGVERAKVASACWPWLANAGFFQTSRDGVIRINNGTQLSYRNTGKVGEVALSRAEGGKWTHEALLVGNEPILGVGLTPPLHGALFSMDVIRRHQDGSIVLTTYVMALRK
jgi:hypothetical protein